MILVKDKKYMLNCRWKEGLYDYNRYMGEGIYTGANEGCDNEEVTYGFKIPNHDCVVFFLKEDIVAEISDDNLIKESEQTDIARLAAAVVKLAAAIQSIAEERKQTNDNN